MKTPQGLHKYMLDTHFNRNMEIARRLAFEMRVLRIPG